MYNDLIKDNDIIAIFEYGSSVYGTTTDKSDKDLIVITKDAIPSKNYSKENLDVTVYTHSKFQEMIKMHEISALECLFLKPNHVLKKEIEFSFDLDKIILRNSISAKSSNSWVKAKKKFIVEVDYNPYVGQKSAWHSIRMLDFGSQIAKNGKINDYTTMNFLLKEILKCETWPEIEQNFKLIYNNKASEFRVLAPKEVIKKNTI